MTQLVPNIFLTQTAALQTTLYRTYAYRHHRSQKWKIVVHGRRAYNIPTHLNLTKRLMLRGLLKRLEIGNEVLSNPSFQSRVSGFLVNTEPGERIKLRLDDLQFALRRRTRKSGLFAGRVTLPQDFFEGHERFGAIRSEGKQSHIETNASTPNVATRILPAETYGLSIVSDIDDTVKLTDVSNRKSMLERTFIHPFDPVDGMADLYQSWAQQFPALFHYVSSSPCQLYSHLEQFLDEYNFPLGSIQLRWFTLREELMKKWKLSRGRKKEGFIRTLLKRMPKRKFVLVGDSSESDPEIYANLAQKFPGSILGIIIRDISSRPMIDQRMKTLKPLLNGIPFEVFRDPSEVKSTFEKWRVKEHLNLS